MDEPRCGDGVVEGEEVCDGDATLQTTCEDEGYTGGTLACAANCTLDVSNCTYDPCVDFYPCDNPGTRIGSVIDDLSFPSGNVEAYNLGGPDGNLDLHDLFQNNVAHGGELKGLMLFAATGWCPYCRAEADRLDALYQEYKDQGIVFVGVILEDNRGYPGTVEYADKFATEHGWTFPAVTGEIDVSYWPRGENQGSVPFHMFVDLTNMRIFGRAVGAQDPKLVRFALNELAAGAAWNDEGGRTIDFQCGAELVDENEPNNLAGDPEDGTQLPFEMSGAICAPTIEEGLLLDEDDVDLGELETGTVIDVSMSAHADSGLSPMVILMRMDSIGRSAEWYQLGPTDLLGGDSSRQWIIDTPGRYVLEAADARLVAGMYYGSGEIPESDACCEGGPDFTYDLNIAPFTLAATESPLTVGGTRQATMSDSLQVYPLEVTAGTEYTVDMKANIQNKLNPYLVVYDAGSGAILAFNDDVASGTHDARVTFTPETAGTVYVVASYKSAFFVGGAPPYQLSVK